MGFSEKEMKSLILILICVGYLHPQGNTIPRRVDTLETDVDSLYTKTSHIVNVMDYIDSYDTTGNWQPAIQAAINTLEPLIGLRAYGSAAFGTVGVVILPALTMEIDSSINLYSGITLQGQGFSSELKEGSGFAGEQLITLYGKNNYVDNAKVKDVQLTTTNIRGIGNNLAGIVNCIIEGIALNCKQGIVLDEYTQATVIRDIYSYGSIDTLIYLEGNFNYIENVDKEGNTGDAVGAYIYLGLTSLNQPSGGNELHNILIEGTTSANKSGMIIRGSRTIINNYWFEANNSDGYMLRIEGGAYNQITGLYAHVYSTQKTKIDSTQYMMIDFLTTASESNKTFSERFEKDESSTVVIKDMEYFGVIDNPLMLNKINNGWVFDRIFNRFIYTSGTAGYKPESKINYMSAANWLINGSFEQGAYQWNYDVAPDTVEFSTSEIDKGLMGRFKWNTSNTVHNIYQNITIPSVFLGQVLTLSAFVKATSDTADSWAFPLINGCGITYSSGINRVYTDSGWQIITQTFEPQSAGTLTVGVGFYKMTEIYIDDINLSIGTETILNSNKYGSLDLNTNSITYASSAPTTGTHKQGDIVFNSAVDNEGYMGWVCTSAGTPGTWTQFGGTIETRGGLYEKAITITPTNSTSYALTVNGTQKTTGYTYGYHELMIPLLNYTIDDSIPIAYTTAGRVIDSIRYKMDDSTCFNIKYGVNGYGTSIFNAPDTLVGSGVITSFDDSIIPVNNEAILYFPYFGDTAVRQFLKIYYHDFDTVNVYAVNLNGTNESMTKTTPTDMDITGVGSEFTVMGWFKSPDVTHDNVDIARRQNTYDIWQVGKGTDGKPYFFMYENSPVSQINCIASSAVTDSTWYHFAATIGTDSTRIYVNGTRQYGAGTTYPPLAYDVNDAPNLTIGGWSPVGGVPNTQNSNSTIGEVQIINNHALTQGEIINAYNLTLNGSHYPDSYSGGNVVAWYKWGGEDDATFLEDASGSGNNLTGNNVDRAGDQVIINGGYK